jgi:hypothetical protein
LTRGNLQKIQKKEKTVNNANNEVYETEKHCAAIEMEWVPVINIILYIVAFSQVTITVSLIVVATFRSSYTKRKRRKHSDEEKKQVVVQKRVVCTCAKNHLLNSRKTKLTKHSDGRKKKVGVVHKLLYKFCSSPSSSLVDKSFGQEARQSRRRSASLSGCVRMRVELGLSRKGCRSHVRFPTSRPSAGTRSQEKTSFPSHPSLV